MCLFWLLLGSKGYWFYLPFDTLCRSTSYSLNNNLTIYLLIILMSLTSCSYLSGLTCIDFCGMYRYFYISTCRAITPNLSSSSSTTILQWIMPCSNNVSTSNLPPPRQPIGFQQGIQFTKNTNPFYTYLSYHQPTIPSFHLFSILSLRLWKKYFLNLKGGWLWLIPCLVFSYVWYLISSLTSCR